MSCEKIIACWTMLNQKKKPVCTAELRSKALKSAIAGGLTVFLIRSCTIGIILAAGLGSTRTLYFINTFLINLTNFSKTVFTSHNVHTF